jgi:hypothetical protein
MTGGGRNEFCTRLLKARPSQGILPRKSNHKGGPPVAAHGTAHAGCSWIGHWYFRSDVDRQAQVGYDGR